MARPNILTPAQATGQTGEAHAAIEGAACLVPKRYQGMADGPVAPGFPAASIL